MFGFFRTIALLLLAYYVYKFIIVRFFAKSKRSNDQESPKSKNKSKKDELGDYVDYEEISDK